MGRDKALIEVDGRPLVARVAEALAEAGAAEVVTVGGDVDGLARHGLRAVADCWPGAGPLGGIVTALGLADADLVLVTACDLVEPSAATMATTVAALGAAAEAVVATPVLAGHRRWDQAAWRRRARGGLAWQFEAGERAVHGAVTGARLPVVEVTGVDPASLADADTPADLPPL